MVTSDLQQRWRAYLDDPEAQARLAGLRYTGDDTPGWTRRRCGRGFGYLDDRGQWIRDPAVKARLKALAIPPAWGEIWIAPDPLSHLQATGRDEAGRKQYRYHARWSDQRRLDRFDALAFFGAALGRIRRAYTEAISARGRRWTQDRVLAAAAALLDNTWIRVGNDQYLAAHGSVGLVTLHTEHLSIDGDALVLEFNAKHQVEQRITREDPLLADALRRLSDLPGDRLFVWRDESGAVHPIRAESLNGWLMEIGGSPFTAKDFRSWGGCLHAAAHLGRLAPPEAPDERQRLIREAVERACSQLGNTPAVCQGHYIHPALITAWARGDLHGAWAADARGGHPALSGAERALLRFLSRRLARRLEGGQIRAARPLPVAVA